LQAFDLIKLSGTIRALSLQSNLRALMEKRKLNVNQLSIAARIPSGHLSQIMTGKIRDPRGDVLEKLAVALSVTMDDLRSDDAADVANVDEPRDVHAVSVPVEAVVVGGDPTEAAEAREEDYYLLRHLYRPWRKVIRLFGESMYPTFHSGDLLLVDPKDRVRDGMVAVVKLNGETTVKRVYGPKKGKFVLRADNPLYPPIIAEEGDEVEIVGKVIRIVEGERE